MPDNPPIDWRFVLCADVYAPDSTYSLTGWETHNISMLSGLASQVELTFTLNRAGMLTFTVPSEDPRINGLCDIDGLPMLCTGKRAVKAYRRVGNSGPWVLRFAGRVWSLQDHGDGDTVQTQVTCYDPLKILEKRICRDVQGCYVPGLANPPTSDNVWGQPSFCSPDRQVQFWRDADCNPAMRNEGDGGAHDYGQDGQHGGSWIIKSLIFRTTVFGGANPGGSQPPPIVSNPEGHCHIDLGGIWMDTTPMSITFDQKYVMDAIVQICDTGLVDLNVEYLDVFNGVFVRLGATDRTGTDTDVHFAYAADPDNASEYSRSESLDTTANYIDVFAKKVKGWNAVKKDDTSIENYLLMEDISSLSDIEHPNLLGKIANMALQMRKDPRNIVQVVPTPESNPLPFDDYYIGDTVHVDAGTDPYPVTRETISGVQRIYQLKVTLDDDFGEYVSEMVVSPQTGLT